MPGKRSDTPLMSYVKVSKEEHELLRHAPAPALAPGRTGRSPPPPRARIRPDSGSGCRTGRSRGTRTCALRPTPNRASVLFPLPPLLVPSLLSLPPPYSPPSIPPLSSPPRPLSLSTRLPPCPCPVSPSAPPCPLPCCPSLTPAPAKSVRRDSLPGLQLQLARLTAGPVPGGHVGRGQCRPARGHRHRHNHQQRKRHHIVRKVILYVIDL